MIPIDLHLHSEFSCDANSSMQAMARAAVAAGIEQIGFSEHFDLLPDDPCAGLFDADAWWLALEGCRSEFQGALIIRAGIEIGEPHRFQRGVSEILAQYDWDYSLGSLHWVEDDLIFARQYYEQSPSAAYGRYFTELALMAGEGEFDVLAHMDIVKRYGHDYFGPFDPQDYEQEIRRVLKTCVRRGIALEINTSAMRRPVSEPSPGPLVLEWYRDEGGTRVTLGSDAHHPQHVGHGLAQVMDFILQTGIDSVTSFHNRQPEPKPIPR
jgi:histidinol-phosphatase (PHP family)